MELQETNDLRKECPSPEVVRSPLVGLQRLGEEHVAAPQHLVHEVDEGLRGVQAHDHLLADLGGGEPGQGRSRRDTQSERERDRGSS